MKLKLNEIKNWILRRKEALEYTIPFGLITFTPEALDSGIKDEQNKVILVYEYNYFSKLVERRYTFSDSRVKVLESKGIPIHDKTQGEDRFPVYSRIMPGEAVYTSKF